jgi:hypothetical protein
MSYSANHDDHYDDNDNDYYDFQLKWISIN